MLEMCALASGSSGNSFFVGTDKSNILIDAGISCRQIKERLALIGKSMDDIGGIFVTHEHIDHIRGIEAISKKYNTPVFLNSGTLCNCYDDMGNIQLIDTNKPFDFGGVLVHPFSKSHDAAEPVSYIISDGKNKVGVLTDIGYCCPNVINALKQCNAVFLESNHDINMLKTGRYPEPLKNRILGEKGHISNYEAALLVLEHARSNLSHAVLSHLSENNNTPDIALKTFKTIVSERKDLENLNISVSSRKSPTKLICIE